MNEINAQPGSIFQRPSPVSDNEPRIFTQLSDELKRLFSDQLSRLESQLKPPATLINGPRKPDLTELEDILPPDPPDTDEQPTEA